MKSYAKTFALFVLLLIVLRLITPFLGVVDDAWITYTYARNLAAGYGIAFNPGEHVEGCTAFLHMLMLAPFAYLTERLDYVGVGLNILAWAALAVIAWTFIRRRDGGKVGVTGWSAMALIAMGLSGLGWVYSGMEMPLVALAWLGGAKLHLRERESGVWPWASALATVAAGLLRPDGILLAIPLALSTWIIGGKKKLAWGRVIVYSVIVLGLFGGYWLWRWHYFGWPLPNTFYAKVTRISTTLTITGIKYTLRWMFGMIVPLIVLAVMFYARGRRPVPRWVRLMQGMVVTSICYCLLVGSDFFSYHRFLLPAYAPTILIGWWYGVGTMIKRRELMGSSGLSRSVKIVAALAVLIVLQGFYFISPSKPANQKRKPSDNCMGTLFQLIYPPQGLVHWFIVDNTYEWMEVGAELRAQTPENTAIATLPIGAMGYFTHRNIIDMVGLTDVHIAHTDVPTGEFITGHEKNDTGYILDRAPELIYTWPSMMPDGVDGLLKFVMANIGTQAQIKMMGDRRTRIQYRYCRLPVGEKFIIGLIRKDLFGKPEWAGFQPLPEQHEEWLWHAFTAGNIDELGARVKELRAGQFNIDSGPSLDQGVSLPFSLQKKDDE